MAQMMKARNSLILTLSALALLTACDNQDKDAAQPQQTSWLEWLLKKDVKPSNTPIIMEGDYSSDYARETQSGNYLSSQFAQYRQDWKSANVYLDRLMDMDPGNVQLQQRAMVLAMQAGDSNRAISLARKVLEEDHQNILALMFIGVDQMSLQDYNAAIRTFDKMPRSGIADYIRPILVAWAQVPNKKVDQESLITNGPLHAYHALLLADYLGKVQDPERYLSMVINGGGAGDTHILEMMGDVYMRQGQKDLANKIYDTLVKQIRDTMGYETPTALNIERKRTAPELALKERIDTPAKGTAEAFYNMARILFSENSNDSALVFSRLAVFLDPSKDGAKMLMARIMLKDDHIPEAIAFYQSVRPSTPEFMEAQRSAAELLEQEGDTSAAVKILEDDYAKNQDVNALIQIGDIYRRKEKFTEAIQAYNRVSDALKGEIGPEYWTLLYARGISYERSGDFVKAESDLLKALSYKPDHPYLLNYLAYSWADQGKKLPEALEMLQKAVTLKPDDGYIIDSLGWVYYQMKDYTNAVMELERAIEIVPYDPTINDHLGDAYWRVGRKAEARFQWNRAINHSQDLEFNKKLEIKVSEGLKDTGATPTVMQQAKTDKDAGEEPVVKQ